LYWKKAGYNTQEIIVWTRKNPIESLTKIEKDPLIESAEMRASSIGEMREDSIGNRIEISIGETMEISIEERIEISIKDRVDHEILGLEPSSVVNVEPVNSGLSHELEGTAVITHIYPLRL